MTTYNCDITFLWKLDFFSSEFKILNRRLYVSYFDLYIFVVWNYISKTFAEFHAKWIIFLWLNILEVLLSPTRWGCLLAGSMLIC